MVLARSAELDHTFVAGLLKERVRINWISETKRKRKVQNPFHFYSKLAHGFYFVFIAWKTRSNPTCLKLVSEHSPTSKWLRQNQLLVHHKNKSQGVKIELLSKPCKQENLISLKFPTWTPFLLFSKQVGKSSRNIKTVPAMDKTLLLWYRNSQQDNQDGNSCSQPVLSQSCVICNQKKGRDQRRRKMGEKSMLRTMTCFIENQNKNYEGILSLVDKRIQSYF